MFTVLIYRVMAKKNVGEEKKASKGTAVMSTEPTELPERSTETAGPVKPVASAPAVPDTAYPSFTDPGAVAAIVGGYHSTPFDILGIHRHTVDGKPAIVIRTFQPQAQTVSVLRGFQAYPMQRIHQDGFFEAVPVSRCWPVGWGGDEVAAGEFDPAACRHPDVSLPRYRCPRLQPHVAL